MPADARQAGWAGPTPAETIPGRVMTGFRFRRYAADLVALAYVLAFYGWLFTRTPGTALTARIGDLSFYPLGLAVGWACLRNARLAFLDRRTRLAWGALAAQSLLLWFIGISWPHLVQYFGPAAWPGWIGYMEVLQHLLLLAALLAFPGRQVPAHERTRFRLDVSLVLVAGFVLAFYFGLRVTLRKPPVGPMEVAVAQSVLDWILFAAGAVGLLQKRDETTRRVLAFLLLGITFYLYANYTLAGMDHYRLGDAVDGIWFFAWVCRWIAARIAWHRYRCGAAGDTVLGERVATSSDLEYRSGFLSYVMVAGAFTLLMVQVVAGDGNFLSLLAFSAMLMAALLLVRQVVELRENRRLFESQLAQQSRFQSLVQHSSDVVIILGSDGRVSYVSPAAETVFGPGTVVQGTLLADRLEDAGRNALEALFGRRSGPGGQLHCRMTASAGRWLDVDIVWTDMRADASVNGIVLNCRDVTERNELERQLHHAQKLDAVGHLAGGLAHDFNNVLMAIRGYTELLRDELPAQGQAGEDLRHIEHAVDRAAEVTRKLLAFSRKQAVQPRVLDLNRVLADLQPLLRQLMTHRIEVSLETEPRLWPVMADQGQMEQVIINLATNARDAMPEGGVLRIVTCNRTLTAPTAETAAVQPGDHVVMEVRDEGVGMTPEVRARIFEPFFSTKPKDRGMGLGLAMVHGIVTHSGGRITVDSRPGKGACFTIVLPRTQEQAVEAGANTTPAPAVSRAILLVDDEVAVRSIARRMLERAGHRVREAADGNEALEVVARGEEPVDVLVTDMVMPGLHGLDLIAQVRRLRPALPIVCITGFAGEGLDLQNCDPADTAILPKPFSAETLAQTVAGVCARAGI